MRIKVIREPSAPLPQEDLLQLMGLEFEAQRKLIPIFEGRDFFPSYQCSHVYLVRLNDILDALIYHDESEVALDIAAKIADCFVPNADPVFTFKEWEVEVIKE